MPATLRNVAKTDTLETQRQKINLLAQDVYNIGSGGSDLSAGNIKLGDGTRTVPSLAFTSDETLGIYKPSAKTIGYVVDGKKLLDIKNTQTISYKDFIFQKNVITNNGSSITNPGLNYDGGSYSNISLIGGTGDGAVASLTVLSFSGSITNNGANYTAGNFTGITFTGGSGSGATGGIIIDAIVGNITSSGTGYGDGSTVFYQNVPLTGGSGTGAIASFFLNSSGEVTSISIQNSGINYQKNDILSVNNSNLGGNGSGFSFTITSNPGKIASISFLTRGSGYLVNDVLSLPTSVTNVSSTLSTTSTTITVASTSGIYPGYIVTKTSGTGVLASNTTVLFVNSTTNTITLSNSPTTDGSVVLSFTPPWGTPTTNFAYTISAVGVVDNFSITAGGNGYSVGDILSVSPFDLTQPIIYDVVNRTLKEITFVETISSSYFAVGNFIEYNDGINTLTAEIYKVKTSGANLVSILTANISAPSGASIKKQGTSTNYTVNTISTTFRWFINSGSGSQITPNLTLYSGNTYTFNLADSSNNGHLFSLSKYRDGIWSPSYLQNISTTLSTASTSITVTSTTGIVPGMRVTVNTGSSGSLDVDTVVSSVPNSTTVILDKSPTVNGTATLSFRGTEYLDGVVRGTNSLRIKITEQTPNLYYYCGVDNSIHVNEGGEDNQEALLTISTNNPKTFGSGFALTVNQLNQSNVITLDVDTGDAVFNDITSQDISASTITLSGSATANSVSSNSISTSAISSTSGLNISASTSITLSSNTNIGSSIQFNTNGNITTSGVLKTTNSLNINDKLTITDNNISSTTGNNILLTPPLGRVAKVDSVSALTIPSGTTSQRPGVGVAENGSIRFNTQTGQYEGYSAVTSSWSSLGGVRDLDGNTYIAAEASVGANDNTLYFYNDNNNTVKLTSTEFIFNTVKNISSLNTLAPSSAPWNSNTPVNVGEYLNYGFNVYEVTTAGTTAGPANPPTHTTGVASNGTSQLTWFTSYVDSLSFSKVSEVKIGSSLIPTVLIINDGLKLFGDTVSTITNDLILQPYSGKKVTISSNSSLAIPAGTTAQRGIPGQGSIRYNTSLSSFEGYNGVNWTSLGGVKDVDGNTYIIPETSPGSNENILYFYNNGNNTLRLSQSTLEFNSIDAISSTNNNLDINVETLTLNNLAFTIDNTGTTTSKLLSTRTNLDFALSSGVTNDTLIRLNSTGDILINKSYSTGSNTFIKVLDNELKTFELDDVKVETSDLILTKGTTEFGLVTIFSPSLHSGAKVVLIADNTTTNDREIIEYNVISKNGDIYHTEYGNVTSGLDLVSAAFDFDGSGNVRLTPTLVSSLSSGDVVNITVVKTIFKK